MRKLTLIAVLEAYALFLAWVQSLHGVLTDEAKYLLNIPYPHPPLIRSILSLTTALSVQEMLWRIVFASLLVQAVWIVWEIGRGLSGEQRFVLGGSWLLSAALVLQAGTIMMAPLTALEGLVFVALYVAAETTSRSRIPRSPFLIGVLWLASLFTAFQAVLYLPLVFAMFRKMRVSVMEMIIYIIGPMVLAALFALAEPLILASFVNVGTKDVDVSALGRTINLFRAWSIGGSVLLGLLGTAGILLERRWALLGSLLLVCAYVFLSFHFYYAILFLPLFIGGMPAFFHHLWKKPAPLIFPLIFITGIILALFPLKLSPSPARAVARSLPVSGTGVLLINGSFGHEWQYESPVPVRRFQQSLLPDAEAVVCLTPCEEMTRVDGWKTLAGQSVEVWVRK
ncbi:MAG: hypothetical protein WCS85_02835 [Candidatus Peribacteraceae bacterium]|jgi:hypothetical protein